MTDQPEPGRPDRAGLSIRATQHVGFTVRDLEQSVNFYSALFGSSPMLRLIEDRPYLGEVVGYQSCKISIAVFHLPGADVQLELIQYHYPPGQTISMETSNPGIGHICLIVDD